VTVVGPRFTLLSMRNLDELPADLPVPQNDGLTDHLNDSEVPHVILKSTSGEMVSLNQISRRPTVLFIYPRAGSPLELNQNPDAWDLIPGARGCTP
jgi:hypothetical protein